MSYTTPADYAAQTYGFAREAGPYAEARNKAQAWIDALAADAKMCDPLLSEAKAKGFTDTTRRVGEPVTVDVTVANITDYDLETLCARATMNDRAGQVVYAADTEVTWRMSGSFAGQGTAAQTPEGFLYRIYDLDPQDLEKMQVAAARASEAWAKLESEGVMAWSDLSGDAPTGLYDSVTRKTFSQTIDVTAAIVPPYVSDGKPPTTIGDYILQSQTWRTKLRVSSLDHAYSRIRELKWAKERYAQFMNDAQAWGVRAEKMNAEYTERTTPLYTAPTGVRVPGRNFGARRIGSADGFITTVMEDALNSGNTIYGDIDALDSQDSWNYTITPAQGTGSSAADFMSDVTNVGKSGLVTAEFVRTASTTGIAYRKQGSCEVIVRRTGVKDVAKEDCDQWHYLEGKDVMPAKYWAKAPGAIA